MPNLDKTGPNGEGPNTGNGGGTCNGNGNGMGNFGGRGRRGIGRGRCCSNNFGGRGFNRKFSSIEEKEQFLLDELENIRKIKKS